MDEVGALAARLSALHGAAAEAYIRTQIDEMLDDRQYEDVSFWARVAAELLREQGMPQDPRICV